VNDNKLKFQSDTSRELVTVTDIIVYGIILSLGALQFGLSQRATDFFRGDTTYFELAQSIIQEGFYGFDFKPETMLPPGFAVILASICITIGCNYGVLIRSMAVFGTLGFVASYELLRHKEGRTVALVICVLLASSPIVFEFGTRLVFSDLPYFCTSMIFLLFATRMDSVRSFWEQSALWIVSLFMLVGSLMIRSSGIALLTGLFGWLVMSFFGQREAAKRRVKSFFPILLIGVMVQAVWMMWAAKHESPDWPVPGYHASYISQLSVKNGNYPELGTVSLKDIPLRIEQNLSVRAATLVALLTRKEYIDSAWFSPLVVGPILLIVIGVGCTIWRNGGDLSEWYFVSHEAIYLLWPWFELRFVLPVAPLACLYLWRGGKILFGIASRQPRLIGVWGLPISVICLLSAAASGWNSGSLQAALGAIFWALATIASAWIAWTKSDRLAATFDRLVSLSEERFSIEGRSLSFLQISGIIVFAVLLGVGLVNQWSIGRDNLVFDVTKERSYPDIEAARWIQSHTRDTAVVMARQFNVVYHYSRHKVVWFPPLSNPRILMEGIRKYNVEVVIVTKRKVSYWLPPEEDCFQSFLKAYPGAFDLVYETPRFGIFELVSTFS